MTVAPPRAAAPPRAPAHATPGPAHTAPTPAAVRTPAGAEGPLAADVSRIVVPPVPPRPLRPTPATRDPAAQPQPPPDQAQATPTTSVPAVDTAGAVAAPAGAGTPGAASPGAGSAGPGTPQRGGEGRRRGGAGDEVPAPGRRPAASGRVRDDEAGDAGPDEGVPLVEVPDLEELEPLTEARLEASYAGPRTVPMDQLVPAPTPQKGVEPRDRESLRRVQDSVSTLAAQAQDAHDRVLDVVRETARATTERYREADEQRTREVTEAESALDAGYDQAVLDLGLAVTAERTRIDQSALQARRLVHGAAARSKARIAANADTAGAQVTAIINQLAAAYTDLLESTAAAVDAETQTSVTAIREFVATGGVAQYPYGADALANARNEGSRAEVGRSGRVANAVTTAGTKRAADYRAVIPTVRKQFDESELGKQIHLRKDQIRSEGDRTVDRAVTTALGSLRRATTAAHQGLEQMQHSAVERLEAGRRAARAQVRAQANASAHQARAESQAELQGLESITRGALPAFGTIVTSATDTLSRARGQGAEALVRLSELVLPDARTRVSALADTQLERVARADGDTRAAVDSAGRRRQESVERVRTTALEEQLQATAEAVSSITLFGTRQSSSYAAVAGGVSQAAAQWITPLTQVFKRAVDATRKQQLEARGAGSFHQWSQDLGRESKAFLDQVVRPYLAPATAMKAQLDAAGEAVETNLNKRKGELEGAFDYGYIDKINEEGVTAALRGLTALQGQGLRAMWARSHGDLDAKLTDALDDDPDDLAAARYYLNGQTAKGAAAELRASIHWYNDEESRIEAVMRSLKPDELRELRGSKDGAAALDKVRDNLGGTDLDVFEALEQGNHDRADAYRARDRINDARSEANIDSVNTVLAEVGRASTDRGVVEDPARDPQTADEHRRAVLRELAYLQGGGTAKGDRPTERTISDEQAARTVEGWALADMTIVTSDGEHTSTQTIAVTGANRDLGVALIRQGEGSVDARAAKLGVELGRPGGPKMLELDTALVDPRLNPATSPPVPEEVRQQALRDRDAVIQRYARQYAGAEASTTAAAARDIAERRLRSVYGSDTLSADVAVNLVREEHPSPATAAMAMRLASRGAGTDEDLMWRFVERLDRTQVRDMRLAYKAQTGSSLDEDLGTFKHKGWFTELSGDDRLRMERALLGQPRNDQERAEVAAFTMQQQRDETGSVGAASAEGSLAEESLAQAETGLQAQLGGARIRVDGDGNPVWTDATGRRVDPSSTGRFNKVGSFTGSDPRAFRSAVQVASIAAQNYAAKIDQIANFAANAIAVLGVIAAAVATIATGGGASPLLMAAIAGASGLMAMGARAAISGGRYGWEQAATDLGMTAVQAATAGFGQHLALVSRGGTQSLMAGMTTLRSAQGLANSMGAITGSALGDMLLIGGSTGALSGFGTSLLSEETWKHGGLAALGHILEGTLTGALSGTATAAASQAFEALPLGKLNALGRRNTLGEVMGESTNPLIRGTIRGVSGSLGAAVGRGTELGTGKLTGRYKGDAGDILMGMGEAGAMGAIQDFAGGAVESRIHAGQVRAQQARAGSPPPEVTGAHPPTTEPTGPRAVPPEHEPGPRTPQPEAEPARVPAPEPAPVTTRPTSEADSARGTAAIVEALGAGRAGPEPIHPAGAEAAAATGTPAHELAAAGTAAAVGERFRGDAVAPVTERETRRTVAKGVGALVESGTLGVRSTSDLGDASVPVELTVRSRDGQHEIPVEIVAKHPDAIGRVDGEVPVAQFKHDPTTGRYTIEVSTGAHPQQVERALAHELGEIRARESGSTATKDALAPSSSSRQLSPHDHGRLAELEVIARHLDRANAAEDTANAARLRDDAEQLADHLGLVGDSAAAKKRAELALANLPKDSPARALLESAIATAGTNPFLQGRSGNLSDLEIVTRQYERAVAMNDPALIREAVAEARLLLLNAGVVDRRGGRTLGTVEDVAKRLPGRELLDLGVAAATKNPTLTDADRKSLGTLRKPDPGYEASYSSDLKAVPEGKPSGPEVAAAEQRRRELIGQRATTPEAERGALGAEVNRASEALGELAGRKVADDHLKLGVAPENFGMTGKGLPDLLYVLPDGRIVVIECKGGAAELGVRPGVGVDSTKLVGQGTREYLLSMFKEMSTRPGLSQEHRDLAARIFTELSSGKPNVEYFHVSQPIDPTTGRIGTPLVGKFDIGGT